VGLNSLKSLNLTNVYPNNNNNNNNNKNNNKNNKVKSKPLELRSRVKMTICIGTKNGNNYVIILYVAQHNPYTARLSYVKRPVKFMLK
jgi:hypothetical protein